MSRFRPKRNTQPHAVYATCADICESFARDMTPLYLLAFVLTRNHAESERCFVTTMEGCVRLNCVFKGWERSWNRRCLIVNAIRRVFSGPTASDEKPDSWCEVDVESRGGAVVNALTTLAPPLQRFVFVMSVLERYSDRECALLLRCTLHDVAEARILALRQLSSFKPAFAKSA
jgi:hypothetical protein